MSEARSQHVAPGPPDEELSYEAAVTELEAIVTALQRDDVGVDELAAKVARGAVLVEVCRARLHAAEVAVEEVVDALRATEHPGEAADR
jgi:exodeoxyribonuclease VII small subunit